MKVAKSAGELSFALSQARTEAKAAFGNDTVYMEKYLQRPRHIEIQILADAHGHVVHLGERDCSLQRRHQKVWEEAGSPALNAQERDEIGGIVTRALEKLGYLGAGTIEFLYEDGRYTLIDFDYFAMAETSYDLAKFCAYVIPSSPQGWEETVAAEATRRAFLRRYRELRPDATLDRFQVYEALILALRAMTMMWMQHRGWEEAAQVFLVMAQERLNTRLPD